MTLAHEIEQDLARRITRGDALPCELKLEPLARHYGVSTRPIRQAMASLKRQGLLQASRLKSLPIETTAEPASLKAASDDLFTRLTHQLIEQSLRSGDEPGFIRETTIAQQLNVSTTVVREMFSKLVGHGLLIHVPRRGWQLRPLRQKDLDDFIQVRLSLETLALQLAWDKLDLTRIRQYLDANTPARGSRPAHSNNDFHSYIIEQADNHYIRDFFERQGRYFQLLFQWEDQPTTTAQTIRQHRAILTAILKQDQPAAIKALRVHIQDNHPLLTRMLASRAR
jgi:DNA-binding GntR family transcriptional regulator